MRLDIIDGSNNDIVQGSIEIGETIKSILEEKDSDWVLVPVLMKERSDEKPVLKSFSLVYLPRHA